MAGYEGRRLMLDPGLTALALRGLHERSGHYPFLDHFRARGRSSKRGVRARRSTPWRRALQWCLTWHRPAAAI
jgi:hypothetical protein